MNGMDTEQTEETDTRLHNQQKESEKDTFGVSGQSDAEQEDNDALDRKRIQDKNENQEMPHAGDGPRSRNFTEQTEETDTRLHNQQKESEKDTFGVSGQSDAEQEDNDALDRKRIQDKNENQEMPHAGDGLRSRKFNNKQKIGGDADSGNSEERQCNSDAGPDTEQTEDTDTRLHNQQKASEKDTFGVSSQSDAEQEDDETLDLKHIQDKNENQEVPYAGDGPRLRTSNKKEKTGLDTDTGLHNQQRESEREDHDTSDGNRIKGKNENQEMPHAGDGPRQRKNKQKTAHLDKGDIFDHAETSSPDVIETCSINYLGVVSYGFCILLAIYLLLVVVPWFTSSPHPQQQLNLLEVFCQELNKVQASFPSQRRELWRRSKIHLQKHLNLTNPTEPVSLILTSGHGAEKTLQCLAQQLAAAFSNTLNSSVINIDGSSKRDQDSDQVKMDIDTTLKNAFAGGKQAAVIHRFEELPPGSTLIFYRYCDHENSAFKKVFLVFTVMLPVEELDFKLSLGAVEEQVQEALKEKFVSSDRTAKFNQMDVDKLSGLWSRISHLILPVAAEQKIEQHGCGEDGSL
ncbi:torsin-1A-interacting protein 2 isoform X2 [Silurus meridionalis]|uniref:torsin-1A-interacting protein 2 isoform X2 n=1 Tax=Silurus meridionalis TaxID=175797 RepID=UPI001EEB9368|nr:torsin-1A-interacting protein 2 isoform X2 [Silurus meridionalis]